MIDDEDCLTWENKRPVQVIEKVNFAYKFTRKPPYTSCQWTEYIAFLNATGEWKSFNLSANVLQVTNKAWSDRTSAVKVGMPAFVLS